MYLPPKMLQLGLRLTVVATGWLAGFSALAESTNPLVAPLAPLPDAAPSLLRVIGALILVLGLFLGGVWLFRNWQRLALQRGSRPKLNVLETRPLGGRQALYVVGYEQGRFLIASSPAGVSLLSHLPDAPAEDLDMVQKSSPFFQQTLAKLLKGK